MKVKLLTPEQTNLLIGAEIANSYFANPFLDADGNNVLSIQESDSVTNPDYLWIKELPEIDYSPIPFDLSEFNVN
jgi:hypothetical protein